MLILSLNPPFNWFIATRCEVSEREAIRSATASAWLRSIFPFRKARSVNSPGLASLQPSDMSICITRLRMYSEPWQENSTESSPVYECGALNETAMTSSSVLPSSFFISPNTAVLCCISENAFLYPLGVNILEATAMDSSPDIRIMPNAPPVAVAMAQIVSCLFIVLL